MGRGLRQSFALLLVALQISGCTTVATRVAVVPPSTNKNSFRECLLDRGFYSYDALTGIPLRDWHYRHNDSRFDDLKDREDRYALLEQNDGAFVIRATRIIAAGLMPTEQYSDPRVTDTVSRGAANFADKGVNHPYVDEAAPQRYPIPKSVAGAAPVEGEVAKPSIGYAEGMNWRLNRFLDCYIAPVGMTPSPGKSDRPLYPEAPAGLHEHGDEDIEGRLLRGHILLTLLAQYGTELIISHPSGRQVAQAELLLGHIKDAETALRRSSLALMDPDELAKKPTGLLIVKDDKGRAIDLAATGKAATVGAAAAKPKIATITILGYRGKAQPSLEWFDYTTRLLRVFQVGVDIQRIDAQQTLDSFSNLIAAFSGPVKGFESVLRDGLRGVVTVQKIKLYGGAYLRDARGTLAVARNSTSRAGENWTYDVQTLAHGWRLWDAQLVQACTVLATVAKKDPAGTTCVPVDPANAAS